MILPLKHILLSAEKNEKIVLSLGFFDGIHRGHRALLDKAAQQALQFQARSGVLTIVDENNTIKQAPRLFTEEETNDQFAKAGVNDIYYLFFEDIRTMPPEVFFQRLSESVSLAGIVCGFNYRFGYKAAGDARLLEKLCHEQNIPFFLIPPVMYKDKPISISRIRLSLSEGHIEEASEMLGRPISPDVLSSLQISSNNSAHI